MAHFYYPTLYSAHLLGRLWAWLVETNETAVFGCYVGIIGIKFNVLHVLTKFTASSTTSLRVSRYTLSSQICTSVKYTQCYKNNQLSRE